MKNKSHKCKSNYNHNKERDGRQAVKKFIEKVKWIVKQITFVKLISLYKGQGILRQQT